VAPSSGSSYAYYALQQTTDTSGVPSVTWSDMATVTKGTYQYQYVVERMCTGALPVVDSSTNCTVKQTQSVSAKQIGAAQLNGVNGIYYRVTVHVTGPHQSESFIQAMFMK
jgi:hypothetical protein